MSSIITNKKKYYKFLFFIKKTISDHLNYKNVSKKSKQWRLKILTLLQEKMKKKDEKFGVFIYKFLKLFSRTPVFFNKIISIINSSINYLFERITSEGFKDAQKN